MPVARNFRRVSFAWQRRASALRRCARRMFAAALSSNAARADRLSAHDSTKALNAVRTWHTVRPGLFFPPPGAHPGAEQVGQRHQPLVADQPRVTAPLEVVQAQLGLAVLKAALDAPAAEADQQQGLHRRARRRVADEVLDLRATQRVP